MALTVLALDTTTREGSCAVVREGVILREVAGDPAKTHGERLPQDLIDLLGVLDLSVAEIDLLAVAAGPGSFTGLRVGIATVQGLAMALGRKIVPVPSLEALARTAVSAGTLLAPWMDAQRGEVFAALYDKTGEQVLAGPAAYEPRQAIEMIIRAAHGQQICFVGDGAQRYHELIVERLGARADVSPFMPVLAGVIGRIACSEPLRAVAPHAVIPLYVRRSDAELARARAEGRT